MILALRMDRELLEAIENAVNSANVSRREEPYTVSSWLRAAIREKLAHLRRSRTRYVRIDGYSGTLEELAELDAKLNRDE